MDVERDVVAHLDGGLRQSSLIPLFPRMWWIMIDSEGLPKRSWRWRDIERFEERGEDRPRRTLRSRQITAPGDSAPENPMSPSAHWLDLPQASAQGPSVISAFGTIAANSPGDLRTFVRTLEIYPCNVSIHPLSQRHTSPISFRFSLKAIALHHWSLQSHTRDGPWLTRRRHATAPRL